MKINGLIYLIFIWMFGSYIAQAQKRCGFDEIYQELSKSPEFLEEQLNLNKLVKNSSNLKTETVFIVPTVIHIIYKNSGENLLVSQIQSQLDVLNEDFRKLNADTTNVEVGFSKADVRIEFCLAQRDPYGDPTTGITRTFTSIDNVCDISSTQYYQLAKVWDPSKYLNIWVCDIDNVTAGYAYPPNTVSADKDGVVIQFENFGNTGNVQSPYDGGRSTTHEVGHWFNLLHPWGNGNSASCFSDDGVLDTPEQGIIYSGCPNPPKSSCSSKDMLSNFMGYVDDACMGNFTEGQKDRMRVAIVNARSSLLLSKGCLPVGLAEEKLANNILLYPNPVSEDLFLNFVDGSEMKEFEILLIDTKGKELVIQTIKTTNGFIMRLDEVADGVYFVRIKTRNQIAIKKLVVAH